MKSIIRVEIISSGILIVVVSMPNPICEKCKPADKPAAEIHSAVHNTGCGELYPAVDACMKQYQGNIASCRLEWDAFQQCMKRVAATDKK